MAERIFADTQKRIKEAGVTPGLAVILVGNDEASHLYVGLKEKAAARVGVRFEKYLFAEDVSHHEILTTIEKLNQRSDIHGILVQLPLPDGLPTDEIIATIDPKKDTDGFHQETIRQFLLGSYEKCPVFPRAIVELLRETGEKYHGEKGVVIANSELMGKVMQRALLCEGIDAQYVLSSQSREDIAAKTREARVIVTACGKPRFLAGDMLHEGAVIIDGGIEHEEHRVVGDIDRESVELKCSFLSPVPGGVGPVTVASLLARVTDAAIGA